MIIKETDQDKQKTGLVLPLKKNIFQIKINKSIEIVIVHNPCAKGSHQENVGIVINEKDILAILSKRYANVSITKINNKFDLDKLLIRKPDLVFSGVKYFNFNNKKVWLNDCLEAHGIPYIASSRAALLNESDKNLAKKLVLKAKIKSADFFISTPEDHQNESSIPISFPLFVKPITGGDSRGVNSSSIVFDFLGFKKKVLEIKTQYNLASLVETYLPGKEYSVGIFEDSIKGTLQAMPIEIIVKKNINGHRILDFDAKKNDEEKVIAVKDKQLFKKLSILAKKAFKALGGKSLGRIDIKMNDLGVPHFMEANFMPGLRKGYFYRSCVLNLGMNYEDMIFNITNTGLSSNEFSKINIRKI